MIYPVIILLTIICTIVTLFLIKESFSSKKRIIFIALTILATFLILFSSLFTVFISLKEKEKELENKTIELQNNKIELEKKLKASKDKLEEYDKIFGSPPKENTTQVNDEFIIFDNVSCSVISKNFNDTEIDNTNTEFTFYNHPENINNSNTLTFSFILNTEYNIFSTCIKLRDNITIEDSQTTSIQIFADEKMIYSSEKLQTDSMPLYLNLNLNNVTKLSFSISTNMLDIDKNIFRTISFSETRFE